MYAITIRQPWVDLILAGEKTFEFRRWGPIHEARRGGGSHVRV